MTEPEAREWIRDRFGVPRETLLERFGELLVEEAAHQNLISASTLPSLWSRHFVDSAQLIPLAADHRGTWVDIGSGAGLPGLVVAILTDRHVVMIEPRSRRTDFLASAAEALALADRVEIHTCKIENYEAVPAAILSARALTELGKIFRAARHCADPSTLWLLPKGRSAQSEVDAARAKWQGVFHVEPSITSPDSGIVIARGVRPR